MSTQTEAARDAAKKQLAADKDARSKVLEQHEATEGVKPTPTQDENDMAKLGVHLSEHEPDGSPEHSSGGAPKAPQHETRQVSAQAARPGYQTRAAGPAKSGD